MHAEPEVMTPLNAPPPGYLRTLVVDSNSAAANQLAEQLGHSGFQTDVATSCTAAHVLTRSRHYGALVVVADLSLTADLECLYSLRRRSPSTWIIVICSRPHPNAQQLRLRGGADSLLIAPFSMEELTFRLSALSHRSRPA
jgi:DNA-binding response OmpR family regulator